MSFRHVDRLGAAMLVGALLGFLIGAVSGLSSDDLSAPVLRPFAYAAVGVAVGALVAATTGASKALERGRREAAARDMGRERRRRAAHQGWIDDIDLSLVARRDQMEGADQAEQLERPSRRSGRAHHDELSP